MDHKTRAATRLFDQLEKIPEPSKGDADKNVLVSSDTTTTPLPSTQQDQEQQEVLTNIQDSTLQHSGKKSSSLDSIDIADKAKKTTTTASTRIAGRQQRSAVSPSRRSLVSFRRRIPARSPPYRVIRQHHHFRERNERTPTRTRADICSAFCKRTQRGSQIPSLTLSTSSIPQTR